MKKIEKMKKTLAFLFFAPLLASALFTPASASDASMTISANEYNAGDEIVFEYSGTSKLDWIGIYNAGETPGTVSSTLWGYAYEPSSGKLSLPADMDGGSSSPLQPGSYVAYLCENDGYNILAEAAFTVLAVPEPDAGEMIAPADVVYTRPSEKSAEGTITVTPGEGASENLRYIAYFGDDNGPLEGYSEAAFFPYGVLKKDIAACTVIPPRTTTLYVYPHNGTERGGEYFALKLTGAEANETPLRKFWVVTDMHVCSTDAESAYQWNGGTYYFNENNKAMFKDISALADVGTVGIFTVGDNTNHGYEAEWQRVIELKNEYLTAGLPMYFTLGNHESYWSDYNSMISLFKEYGGAPSAYYYDVIEGMYFIHLGSASQTDSANIDDTEQQWLRGVLDEAVKAGAPTFVFLHQPLLNTVSGSLKTLAGQTWGGHLLQNKALTELFAEYPNVVLMTGHTHWKFDSLVPVVNGGGEGASFVNCASVGYLWNDDDTYDGGSQGLCVEVYSDHIILRAREFVKGEWLAYAEYELPLMSKYSVEPVYEEVVEAETETTAAEETAIEATETEDTSEASADNGERPKGSLWWIAACAAAAAVIAAVAVIAVKRGKNKG